MPSVKVEVDNVQELREGNFAGLRISADDDVKEILILLLGAGVSYLASGREALALSPRRELKGSIMFRELIIQQSTAQGLDPCLVAAVIRVESSFRPDALREEGHLNKVDGQPDASVGLMQVLVSTARDFDKSATRASLMDAETNISIGTQFLAWLSRQGVVFPEGIDAYNVGLGNFRKGRRNSEYTRRVHAALEDVCQ